ncbi:hypothetical protein [Pyrococcus abyssi]|uniref:HEAT repeat domain-containing protein n=1 Tax=Pyrococcus abyssi (strain GE5 / Orsay) TaxID=272844 RepID=Q9V0Z1_PYRAB|nr:hypothetical protein [Pyrococcus abyssi]CAB49560.1 Hypothetical protein PAB1940 [Pyrococcus abyssi GE5]CCE70032.1 TPA: hypothetical protein PAB1940 [Pyrococcus abyssi GE5]
MSVYDEYLDNLKGWRIRKALEIVREKKEEKLEVIKRALQEKDPLVKKGTLYIIKKLAMKKELSTNEIRELMPSLIRLLDDKDESVVLQTVETINAIINFMDLPEDLSSELSDVLIGIVENKPEPINEYAAEGVATLGAKIIMIARKIFSWIRGILQGKSTKKKVSALRVLREIVTRTKNEKIMEEAFNLALDVLNDEDPVVRSTALKIIEVAIDRREFLSRESLEKASAMLGSSSIGKETKEKIDEILQGREEKKVKTEVSVKDYSVEIIKEMFEREQHMAVLELAKSDYKVLQLVIRIFLSEDLLTKLDALWVISNATSYIKIDDAMKIIPQLEEFLLHYNPWVRSTSAKVLADLALEYSSIMEREISKALELIESNDEKLVIAGIELADALLSRIKNIGFLREVMKRLIRKDRLPREALDFIKKYESYIEELEPEIKRQISIKLVNSLVGEP